MKQLLIAFGLTLGWINLAGWLLLYNHHFARLEILNIVVDMVCLGAIFLFFLAFSLEEL